MFGMNKKKEDIRVQEYKRVVNYYETDKMGITHHANYIHFMEEARVYYLEKVGWSFAKLEKMGALSPVVNIDVNYKKPTTFSDEITVKVYISEYNGYKFIINYEMTNSNGDILCTAKSVHVFLNSDGKVMLLDKWNPEFDKAMKDLVYNEETNK